MSALDIFLVFFYSIPLVSEWARMPHGIAQYCIAFVGSMVSFFAVFTLSVHLAGVVVLVMAFLLCVDRLHRLRWRVMKRMSRIQAAIDLSGLSRVRRLVALSDAMSSLTDDLLDEVERFEFDGDPFTTAMGELTDVVFERACRRCDPSTQSRYKEQS